MEGRKNRKKGAKRRGFWRRAACAAAAALLALSLAGCGQQESTDDAAVERESYYFDTICKITVYDMKDMSQKNAEKAIQGAFKECARYENLLSKTKEGSDVCRINHAGGEAVSCDPETIEVIQKGIEYGDLSGGLFDITIGKAEDLYDFHSDDPQVPSAEDLAAAVASVDYHQIVIEGDTVRLTNPEGEIDLGGIGKGFVADKVGDYLESQGVTSAIISLGGNLVCIGGKDGGKFTLGIEKPFSNQSRIVGTVKARNKTLVTSGIYERYFKKNGKLYHHILDPETGEPVDTDLYGVTIIADKGHSADCDALATICLMLGSEKGKAFIEEQDGYEALFIDKDYHITKTSGMKFQKGEQAV